MHKCLHAASSTAYVPVSTTLPCAIHHAHPCTCFGWWWGQQEAWGGGWRLGQVERGCEVRQVRQVRGDPQRIMANGLAPGAGMSASLAATHASTLPPCAPPPSDPYPAWHTGSTHHALSTVLVPVGVINGYPAYAARAEANDK